MTKSPHWAADAIFYHIYPLGFCGAPPATISPARRSTACRKFATGCHTCRTWASTPSTWDRSLNPPPTAMTPPIITGSTAAWAMPQPWRACPADLHQRGMRLILDGVFNHVGRDFWAFRDVQHNRESSPYRDWFSGLRFDGRSPYGDPFTYEPWNGHYDLVRLNLAHPAVREHLFEAIRSWVRDFDIDGLRLDVADCLDFDFLRALHDFCSTLKPDFWLMGEVVHGDYRRWVNPQMLDSVTNYEAYKGLYSSLAEKNYFEIAYALNRQFGPGGLYARPAALQLCR